MSRHANRIDEVLGFKAPKWVDEIAMRRKIDRRGGDLNEIAAALRDEVNEYRSKLIDSLRNAEALAHALGFIVVALDLGAMHEQIRRSSIDIGEFYQHMRDPRIGL